MGLFQKLFTPKSIQPPLPSAAPSSPPAPPRPKTLAELEQELEQEAQQSQAQLRQRQSVRPRGRLRRRLGWSALLLGVPVAAIALVNSPITPIRNSAAEHAPILLWPSYLSMDHHFRQAIAQVEQSSQWIDQPTSAADLERGAQSVAQAQQHLDALPLGGVEEWEEWSQRWYGWYDGRLTPLGLNQARTEVARLQAKLFQEQTAQQQLRQIEQALQASREQFQRPASEAEKGVAIADWQVAIDQLRQLAPATLAGRIAQQKLQSEQRDFAAIAQQFVANPISQAKIDAVRQQAWQAAQLGQNPPHRSERWQEVERLWGLAIAELQQVPESDVAGYTQAARLRARYESNRADIRLRFEAEQSSAQALQQSKQAIAHLQARVPQDGALEPGFVAAEVQKIVYQLEQVQPGTTSYAEAQELLAFAHNKLRQIR